MGFLNSIKGKVKQEQEQFKERKRIYAETYASEKKISDDEREQARLESIRQRAREAARAPPITERLATGFSSFVSNAGKQADYLTAPARTRTARPRRVAKARRAARAAPAPRSSAPAVDYFGFGGGGGSGGPTDLLFGTPPQKRRGKRNRDDLVSWF